MTIGALAFFVVVMIAGGIGRFLGQEVADEVLQGDLNEKREMLLLEGFAEAAKMANQHLPIMIDDYTRQDKATVGPGAQMVYHYTVINISPTDSQLAAVRSTTEKNVCSSKDTKVSLLYGARYVYSYLMEDGSEILRVEIDRDTCGYPKSMSNAEIEAVDSRTNEEKIKRTDQIIDELKKRKAGQGNQGDN